MCVWGGGGGGGGGGERLISSYSIEIHIMTCFT